MIKYFSLILTFLCLKIYSNNTDSLIINEKADTNNKILLSPENYIIHGLENFPTSHIKIKKNTFEGFPMMSFGEAIQGKISGLDIYYPEYNPGQEIEMDFRGTRNLNSFNSPLIIIDGFPSLLTFENINPIDIDTIILLKDPAAMAAYGYFSQNGVIIIETKQGKPERININYNGYYGWQRPTRLIETFNGGEFAELKREAHRTNGEYSYPYPDPASDYFIFGSNPNSWESVAMGYEWVNKDFLVAKEDQNGIPIYNPANVRNTNWQELILQDGKIENHHISLSGGTKYSHLYFSTGYNKNTGIIKNTNAEKETFLIKLNHQFFNWLKLNLTVSNSISERKIDDNVYVKSIVQSPIALPRDYQDNVIIEPEINNYKLYNPLIYLNNSNRNKSNNFMGIGGLTFSFSKYLKYNLSVGYSRLNTENEISDSTNIIVSNSNLLNSEFTNTKINFTYQNHLLSFNKPIQNHNLGFYINYRKKNIDYLFNYYLDEIDVNNNAIYPIDTIELNSILNFDRLSLNLNYSYNNKYFVFVNGIYNSYYSFDNIIYPTMGLAWKINKEDFWQNNHNINNLNLRFSFGQVAYSNFEKSVIYFENNLLPETIFPYTKNRNIGTDFAFLDNKITGSIDIYNNVTTGKKLQNAIPLSNNNPDYIEFMSIKNKGVEISINSKNINTQDFKWQTLFLFSKNKEEIIELYNKKEDDVANNWFIGYPVNVYYDYVYDGIWKTDETAELEKYNGSFNPGDIKIKDKNTNNEITSLDKNIIGAVSPKFIMSLNNYINYKNFDLSINIYGRFGQTIKNSAFIPQLNGNINIIKTEYWTENNQNAPSPKPNSNDLIPHFGESMQYSNGSFVRIRQITLSYEVKIEYDKINSLKVFVTTINPFLITKFNGLDPEFTNEFSSPNIKSLVIGGNLNF